MLTLNEPEIPEEPEFSHHTPQKKNEAMLIEDAEVFDQDQYILNIKEKFNPMLILGAKENNTDKIKLALKNGAQINYRDRQNWDPLCWASCKGFLKVVEILIDKGAIDDPNCRYLNTFSSEKSKKPVIVRGSLVENMETSPLQLATVRGHSKVVALLMKNSFNADVIDKFGNTVFHLAAASNDFETFKIFLQLGVNLEKFNCRGHTPKDISTNPQIREAIDEWEGTAECKITQNRFQRGDLKYWCLVCRKFFHKNGCILKWQNYELDSADNFRPECLCVDCAMWRDTKIKEMKDIVDLKDYDQLVLLTRQIEDEKVPLTVEDKKWLEYYNHKLKIEQEIGRKLEFLEDIEDYKTIKKAVFELEEMVPESISLDKEVLERVSQEIKRLNSERNLRFFLDEYGGKLDNPEEDPLERVRRIKEEKERKAKMGNRKRKKKKVAKPKPTKRNKQKKVEKENDEPKALNPEEVLKNLTFDITIEDIERDEKQEDPVDISELQPLISQLDMYLSVAEANSVDPKYLDEGRHLKQKFQKRIKFEEIVDLFTEYPRREYPPDPVWDSRGKRWLDPVTNKPLDPKKPVILPLNPPKRNRRNKKKKQEIEFPSWARERKELLQRMQDLEALLEDPDVTVGGLLREKEINEQIARMVKENKFRVRIEKDQRLIEEFHSKGRKDRQK